MLELTQPLKERLATLPALQGWVVRMSTDLADRSAVTAVDVRMAGATIGSNKTGALLLQPGWQLVLQVRRGADAAEVLSAAFAAVIECLHGWQPGHHGGRGWEPFALASVADAVFADDGLAGIELTFSTGARYMGQP